MTLDEVSCSFIETLCTELCNTQATKLFKGLFRANESVASKNAARLEEQLKRMEAQLQGVTRQVTELKTTVDTMHANADVNQIMVPLPLLFVTLFSQLTVP